MNIIKYMMDVIYTEFNNPPNILDIDTTIDKIIRDKLSVARYGDGEFDIMLKQGNIAFQNIDESLVDRLLEILRSDDEKLVVCLPKVFTSRDLDRMHYYARRCWIRFLYKRRKYIYKCIDTDKVYGDAFITRNYMDLKDKSNVEAYFNKIRQIWNQREVVIVEGRYTRFGVGNNLMDNAKSVRRILCPEKNAYEKYREILECIKTLPKDNLILLALGPTATVLAADLSYLSYQAIDIGHLDIEYEWYLAGATEKISVCNKWTNEANGFVTSDTDVLNDATYGESIIRII